MTDDRTETNARFQRRYETGDTPWDAGRPDFNLIETIAAARIAPCPALDVGCGTGDNAVWLARNGFFVVGTDVSDVAVEKAKKKAETAGVTCRFQVADFLMDTIDGGPFGFLFDRGCFHSFHFESERIRFAQTAAAYLVPAGLWLTIAGNADEVRRGPGPPQRTAKEIVIAVEPYFEILRLQSTQFGSKRSNPPRAWRCLMRKRTKA